MADKAHQMTDAMLEDLEIRIADEYAIASRDMQKKLRDYFDKFNEQEAEQKKLLEAGKITQEDYNNWRFRHEAMGKRWEEMKDILAADLENAQNIALKMSGEKMPDVYALNANYGTYQIEHDGRIDTGFTLYNHDTAEYLLKDTRQLMPGPSTRKAKEIAANEAMQWNKQKIQSAVLQGILQGESPYKVAERLGSVATMNYNASVRYARTMTTSAQNAGRYESFHRAKDLGVDLIIEWQATLDNRTRHDHRMMHGKRTEVDKPFIMPNGLEILYPADCTGDSYELQGEIWNCRCTLLAWVKGFEGDTVKDSPKMGGMSFEEWQNEHAPQRRVDSFEFTPAKTIQEAENYISKYVDSNRFGAIGVSYNGVSVDVANEVNRTIGKFFETFDVEKFGGVVAPAGNTKLGKQIQNATAAYSDIRRSILLNRQSLKTMQTAEAAFAKEANAIKDILEHPNKYDLSRASSRLRRVLENSAQSGRGTIPTTIEEAINHELGHSLERAVKKSDSWNEILSNMQRFNKQLSGYACEDSSEYIAESFCSYMKGENKADPVLIELFNSMRRK